MARIRILIAANAAQNGLAKSISDAGCDVAAAATSLKEALDACARGAADMALVDIRFGGDAASAQKAASLIEEKASIPVVFFAPEECACPATPSGAPGCADNPLRPGEAAGFVKFALYRRETEAALMESRRWLSATLKSIADAVIAVDRGGCVRLMNNVAEAVTGCAGNKCAGRFIDDVVEIKDEKTGRRIPNPVFSAMERNDMVRAPFDIILSTMGGRNVAVGCKATPIVKENGEVHGAVLAFWDVSEARLAQQALARSETKYRLLVENASSIIMRVDLSGNITFFNEFAQSFFGFGENEILGKNFITTLFPRESAPYSEAAAMLRRLAQGGESSLSFQSENLRRGGETASIAWTSRLIKLDNGGREILCVGADITSLKRAEYALAESENKYRSLFEDFLDAIYLADAGGALTEANHAFLDLFGYSEEQFRAGAHLRDIFISDSDLSAFLGEVETRGAVRNYEIKLRKSSGAVMDCLITSSLRPGRGAGFEGVLRDITEQKKAQRELEKARAELELRVQERTKELATANAELSAAYSELQDANLQLIQSEKMAALGRFSSGIAHEIKNPLGIILGGIEYLQIKDLVSIDFREDEFTGAKLPAVLLLRLAADGLAQSWPVENEKQAISALNEVLDSNSFYEKWSALGKTAPNREAQELVRLTAESRKQEFSSLLPVERSYVKFLNRYLLELAYPADCPHSPYSEVFLAMIKIKDATMRADTIVRNLLRFARPSEMQTERLAPESLIDYAINNIPAEEKNHVSFSADYERGLEVDVDRNQIIQVIINVLVNAAQAIPRRSEGRISVRTYKTSRPELSGKRLYCAMEIKDNGVGIRQQDMQRIFEPFFTTKIYNRTLESHPVETGIGPGSPGMTIRRVWRDVRHGQTQGTGLGLSVSKSIVNNHRGDMTLSSVEGEGTTVTVLLPLAQP
ncbi:MAG: PAS domain S-box protein [Elusimicrobiales bacterium]